MENTMGNLENWVRQLNGELNVSEIAKTKVNRKPNEYIKEYRVYLTDEQKCSLTLTNGIHSPKRQVPNLRLTFNPITNRLMAAQILSGG
jgi:hypothetical protein|tara:strand:+ start:135 stop:401 length:267 start_codon:yes stop_codon:yes gene_type:complete